MDGMILIATLFLTCVVLVLGILFCYFAYKLVGIELPFGKVTKDITTPVGEDLMTRPNRIPVDQFVPRTDIPLKVKFSDKDVITKQ